MPLTTTKTITDAEGNVYPYLLLNLAISPLVEQTSVGGSVAMKLTPYRVLEDSTIQTLEDQSESVVYFNVYNTAQTDATLAQAVTSITDAIQLFINGEGL